LKAGEKGKTSRFKRLFSRSKKDPKKQKKQQQSTVAEAPQKPKKMGRTDIWSEKIDNWWAGTKHKRKETEKKERAAETTRIKILALIFTFVAMALAFSLVPLFPQPLPLLLALLVAFVTWMKPRLGMPVGSIVIGIGMLYHLSAANINFIAYLGDIPYRVAFTAIFMGLFVALPIVFYRYRHAIIIDFGILAALSLANTSTAFLAIPLILTMAVFYKKDAIIAAVYYALITTPMLVIEYFNGFIAKTPASVTEWWKLSGSAPPLFEPLVSTFKAFEMPMESFRLFSANVLSDQIIAQFNTYPDVVGKTLHSAIIQYRDSFPGILLFIVIIVGVVLALMVFGVGFI
jgi:hypothetical protein